MSAKKAIELYDHPAAMEPMLPIETGGELAELAFELIRRSARLSACLHPIVRAQVQELVRTMNSYYSNLIEGHNTHPVDIERALRTDYSAEPAKRALQIESRAHVEVQRLIEERLERDPASRICSEEFLCWIHRELYERFPPEFRKVKTRSGGEDVVVPGALRSGEVEVGTHIPPTFRKLRDFLGRFEEAYRPERLEPIHRIIAAAASHHRLAWIHPFLDGNGRVTRLFTHAFLIQSKIDGHGLWTVSRGFARRRDDYLAALANADGQRRNDLDGRGNLSQRGLVDFCRFFLGVALDQTQFMSHLLDVDAIQQRLELYAERWAMQRGEPREIVHLLRDCFLRGEVTRGDATRLLGRPERTARRIIGRLLEGGLISSAAAGAPLRLALPITAVGYYFPRLYPEGVEIAGELAGLRKSS